MMVKPLQLVAVVANIISFVSTMDHHKPPLHGHPQKACRINEVWSNCPTAVCSPKTCDDVGFPVACLDSAPGHQCSVKPGCICKEGYVKNFEDICIPMKHCPSCGGDPNAVSGNGNHCNNLCSNYKRNPGKCDPIDLYNACVCRPGYVFDEITRKCVLPFDCSRMFCKKHEVYDPCPAPCPLRTCGINDAAVSCLPALHPGNPNCAPPKCRCRDGYYRNDVGKCVRWENCPVCEGCNEIYDPCPAPCPPQRCDVNIALILCATPPQLGDPECQPGCRCIENHVRNYTGVCIPSDQCPCLNSNEVYDPCIAPCPSRRCDVDDRLEKCAVPPQIGDPSCVAGCRCIDGYYTNSLGVCVTRAECPPVCKGQNEVYNDCIQGQCSPKNCSQLGFSVVCPRIDPKYCIEGCLCKEDYVRDENGVCIYMKDCPSCGGDSNAVAGCGNCKKRCSDIGKEPVFCTEICFENECDCRDGLVLDDNTNKCVLPEQCTPACGPNEIYNECINGQNNPTSCSQLGLPIALEMDPKNCTKGCLCKEDFVRNDTGVCIPIKECLSCGGDPNAETGCSNYCGHQCSDHKTKAIACPLYCKVNGCQCRIGYVYDSNIEKCVLPKDCTPTCGPDEVFDECVQGHCNPKNCSQLGFPIACPKIDSKYCTKGCLCKPGYLRTEKGVCIPIKECPSCGGDPNAESGCGNHCGNKCSDYDKKNVACSLACQLNGCQCKKGYVYDSNTGRCVSPKYCTPVCRNDEVYSECFNKPCPVQNCSLVGITVICLELEPKDCIKGCLCKNPLMREDDGSCIPIGECKPRCDKPNEYYEPCGYDCPPQTCDSLDKIYECPLQDSDNCKKLCKCKKGFYRNINGECITEAQCRKCMGPHEFYSCGGACDNVCATLSKQNQTICPIINIKCNEMCYCEKNYARARNGTCIRIDQCNADTSCGGKYEVFENCTNPSCRPQRCSEVGFSLNCTSPPACNKGCVCDIGYVRNYTGSCIPIKQCPSCGGDPNAHAGCGIYCGTKCEDLGKEPGACITLCKDNACDCDKGHYYDEKLKKCVLPSECTKICTGKYEVYENCTNPSCRPKKCSEVGFSLNCTSPPACNKGCVCDIGYVRNDTGSCIPIKQCPSCGGDPNAHSGCGIYCGTKCEDLGKEPGACITLCKDNACDCDEGTYYDKIQKKCVLPSECTPQCGTDEVLDPCANDGCTLRNCSQLVCTPTPGVDKKDCKPGCTCKDGYLRSDEGICIPIENCPKYPKCSKHEKFVLCPTASCGPQRCDQLGYPIDCPTMEDGCCLEAPGCICIDDYVRNKKMKCVPKRECPSCGGDINAWSGCGVNCGKKCTDLVRKNLICPRICKYNSCDCKDNFYLDENIDKCVTAENCSQPCGENEVYDKCINGGCGHRNCSQIDGEVVCKDPKTCVGGCTCKKGYLRLDETGVCVPEEKCPKKCNKPNEEYVKCPPTCPPQTCKSLNQTYHCPLIKVKINESDCVGECRCKEGYYRNLNNECICEEDCLKCTGAHEYFSCGPSCDNVCCDLDTQTKNNCTIKNIQCEERCYCEDGYARDENDICVCIEDCPPSCGGDYNAVPGCSYNCNQQCETIGQKVICPRIACPPNGCQCKPGYYFNKTTKKCVTPENCPPRPDESTKPTK